MEGKQFFFYSSYIKQILIYQFILQKYTGGENIEKKIIQFCLFLFHLLSFKSNYQFN